MKKALKSSLSLLLTISIIFSSAIAGLNEVDFGGLFEIKASAYSIENNGLDGLYIDIESEPYTTLAQVPQYGENAYRPLGCAWFASARAKELTGKNIQNIHSGSSWYNSVYSNYGFSQSNVPIEKSLACWTNHVAVVEKVYGDSVIIS